MLAAHEAAWDARWTASDVLIEGDDESQRAVRFAVYHLTSTANPEDDRISIGAGALTGDSYLGHVFWDTEIYLLPFYTAVWPGAARALLMARAAGHPTEGGWACQLGCPSQRLLHRSGKAAGKPAAWLHSARAQKKPRQGAGLVGSIMLAQADLHPNAEFGQNLSRAPGNSSVILASDVLAGVIGHERGCDKAEHRANRNVCGDRK